MGLHLSWFDCHPVRVCEPQPFASMFQDSLIKFENVSNIQWKNSEIRHFWNRLGNWRIPEIVLSFSEIPGISENAFSRKFYNIIRRGCSLRGWLMVTVGLPNQCRVEQWNLVNHFLLKNIVFLLHFAKKDLRNLITIWDYLHKLWSHQATYSSSRLMRPIWARLKIITLT